MMLMHADSELQGSRYLAIVRRGKHKALRGSLSWIDDCDKVNSYSTTHIHVMSFAIHIHLCRPVIAGPGFLSLASLAFA